MLKRFERLMVSRDRALSKQAMIDEIRVEPASYRVKFKSGTTVEIPA